MPLAAFASFNLPLGGMDAISSLDGYPSSSRGVWAVFGMKTRIPQRKYYWIPPLSEVVVLYFGSHLRSPTKLLVLDSESWEFLIGRLGAGLSAGHTQNQKKPVYGWVSNAMNVLSGFLWNICFQPKRFPSASCSASLNAINTPGAKMRPSAAPRLRCHFAAALAAGQSETKTRGLTTAAAAAADAARGERGLQMGPRAMWLLPMKRDESFEVCLIMYPVSLNSGERATSYPMILPHGVIWSLAATSLRLLWPNQASLYKLWFFWHLNRYGSDTIILSWSE